MTEIQRAQLISFGYAHGAPPPAGLVIDLRPEFGHPLPDRTARESTGHDPETAERVLAAPESEGIAAAIGAAVVGMRAIGTGWADVAIGCRWGRRESVVIAERARAILLEAGIDVAVIHRDVDRSIPVDPDDAVGTDTRAGTLTGLGSV